MMETLSLKRFRSDDQGTFGKIRGNGLVLFTEELPQRKNKRGKSCIPPMKGEPKKKYKVTYCYSPHFRRKMYLIMGVDGRSGVRIHSGNLAGDRELGWFSHSYGCPLLGEKYGYFYVKKGQRSVKQRAVLVSRPAIRRFEKHMGYRDFMLEVSNA